MNRLITIRPYAGDTWKKMTETIRRCGYASEESDVLDRKSTMDELVTWINKDQRKMQRFFLVPFQRIHDRTGKTLDGFMIIEYMAKYSLTGKNPKFIMPVVAMQELKHGEHKRIFEKKELPSQVKLLYLTEEAVLKNPIGSEKELHTFLSS